MIGQPLVVRGNGYKKIMLKLGNVFVSCWRKWRVAKNIRNESSL